VVADLYPFGSALFRAGFRTLALDVRSEGYEHIPRRGPAVLASNHVGYLDFAFVALAPPRPRRRVRFVARREVFRHPVAGPLMRALRQIEADPYGDRGRAYRQSLAALEAGEVVGIHPEGTISPSFHPRTGRTGAARMALATGAPLIPTAVWGSQRLITKWRPRNLQRGVPIRVAYGPPVAVVPGDPVATTERLKADIETLLRRLWDTYPEQPAGPDDDWWLPAELGGSAPTPDEAERRLAEQAAERHLRRQAELLGEDADPTAIVDLDDRMTRPPADATEGDGDEGAGPDDAASAG
jgi:1-acyl-sn-glycerol-3-phosphate acyltransferase